MDIHPTAIVAEGAELGEEVTIGPYSVIGSQVKIAASTKVHGHVIIEGRTEIGPGCEIFPNAVLGMRPQDMKEKHDGGRLIIGAGNMIREFVTIHPGTEHGGGLTRIGDNNFFLIGVHLGHDVTLGSGVVLSNLTSIAGHVEIEDKVTGGAMSAVHQFGRVGAMAMLGAGAMASKDVPPYSLVQGDRACLIGLNRVGLERRQISQEVINSLRRAFKILFFTDPPFDMIELVSQVRQEVDLTPEVKHLITFVEQSKRGVCLSRKAKHVHD
jgi:UDP-N-acetylglucosamine acyltransferase